MRGQYYQYPSLCNNGTTMRGQYFGSCIVGGSSLRFLVDEIGTAAAASYGFNPQSSAYSGTTVVLNTGGGNINCKTHAEALVVFLANPTTTVCISIQDQSGNGYHLITANSPLVKQDSYGYLYVDFVGTKYAQAATFFGTTANATMHVVWQSVSQHSAPDVDTFQGCFDFSGGSGATILSSWWQGNQSPSLGTGGFSAFDWVDSQPRHHTFNWNSGTESITEFGMTEGHANTTTNPPYTRFTVGKNDFQGGNMRFYEAVFFKATINANTAAAVVKGNYPNFFNALGTLRVNIGDSNTAAGFVGTSLQWTSKVFVSKGYTRVFGRAIGGKTIQEAINNIAELGKLFTLFNFTACTFVIHLGTNDIAIDGQTGAQAWTKMTSLCTQIRAFATAKGVTCNIVGVTMLPRTSTGFPTERDAFNVLAIANSGPVFNTVVNTTTNANLQNQTNPTYFVDTTHLSATGQTEIATMITAAL